MKKQKKKTAEKFYGDVDEMEMERMKALNEEDMDEDYNPNKPENIDKEINIIANQEEDDDGYDDMENLSIDSDEGEEHKLVER